MHCIIAESGQCFECDFKRLKGGTEEKRISFGINQNIFFFCAYTDACTLSCKIVVASKRPLIISKINMHLMNKMDKNLSARSISEECPLLLFTFLVNSDDCRSIQFEPQTQDETLENHVIKNMKVQSQQVCELRCYREPNCVSYNYGPTADSETASCDLNNLTHLQASSSDFVSKEDYIYRHVLVRN